MIRRLRKLIADFIAPKTTALVVQRPGTFLMYTDPLSREKRAISYTCSCGKEVSLQNVEPLPLVKTSPAPRFITVGEERNGDVTWAGAPPSSGVQYR